MNRRLLGFGNVRGWLSWGVLLVLLALGALSSAAALPDVLTGSWIMVDESPSLMHSRNREQFTIMGVSPGESQWSDGSFFLKWAGEPRPERGYYSLKNGRVWITTYRWVDNERERVEYRGTVAEGGKVEWEGVGVTSDGTKTTWSFTATKQ